MKKFLILNLLLGVFLAQEARASYCNSANASGRVSWVFSPSAFTDGRAIIQLEDANRNAVCTGNFSLIPSIVGSQRFDLMYSNLLAAVSNNLTVYIEFDGSKNLIGVSTYNSLQAP